MTDEKDREPIEDQSEETEPEEQVQPGSVRERYPPPRQTLSYLRELLDSHGIRPKNKLGQNFLIDLNVIDLIVKVAQLGKQDLIVEVGSGTGGLTTKLSDYAGSVLSVEIDPAFASLTEEVLGGRDNVHLFHADILRNKNELNPVVMDALDRLRRESGCEKLKLVANLPYAVATPVISNFLLSDLPFERMVVMVQWEIAERLTARPGRKDYGALSILVQSIANTEIVRRLPPSVFYPRPDVWSAVARVFPKAAKRARVGDVHRFRGFLRDLYTHRRKNLRGAILGFHGRPFTKEEIDKRLEELGLEKTVRAEALDLEQHLRLCAAFGTGSR
jgi:16S rRNA (adenine1518-N6/adenine1519-N6)-dimethyltransferase